MEYLQFSKLPEAEKLTGEEIVPIVQGGKNRKTTVASLGATAEVLKTFPASPIGVANGNVCFIKGALEGNEMIPYSVMSEGLGQFVNVHVEEPDGTIKDVPGTEIEKVVFRDTVLLRRENTKSSASPSYYWMFGCTVKIGGRWYAMDVTMLTPTGFDGSISPDQGYLCNDVRMRKVGEFVGEDIKALEDAVEARHEQSGVTAFYGVVAAYPEIVEGFGADEISGYENSHTEVFFDRKLGKFVLAIHSDDMHPLGGAATWHDWSALCKVKRTIAPYSDFYSAEGEVRTDRLYSAEGRLYRYVDGTLVEIGAKEALFIDMFNEGCKYFNPNGAGNWKTCGGYDYAGAPDKSRPYYVNRLWLTYEEALCVHRESSGNLYYPYVCSRARTMARTLYALRGANGSYAISGSYEFRNSPFLEIVRFVEGFNIINTSFAGCPQLRRVDGGYCTISTDNAAPFADCPLFEYATFINLSKSISFAKNPKATYAMFKTVCDRSTTNPITVTVHADVFAALQGQGTYPFNGGDLQQWDELLMEAESKNITFATA